MYLIMNTQLCAREIRSLSKSRHSLVSYISKHAPSTSVGENFAMNYADATDKKLELLKSTSGQIDHFTKYTQKYKKAT